MGSTWNYISVHARGRITLLEEEGTRTVLTDLMRHFEKDVPSPLSMADMPEGYVDGALQAIAGFELKVEKLETVFKLSQNRDDVSFRNIVTHLESRADSGGSYIAGEMRRLRPELF